MRLAMALFVIGAVFATSAVQAKDIVVEKITQVPCGSCHQDTTKAGNPNAQVPCSSCHLDFLAGTIPAASAAHKQSNAAGRK